MEVVNPKYQGPVREFAEQQAAVIDNYLTNQAQSRVITFDQIRADFPTVKDPKTGKAPMTDGTLAEIFQYLGYKVTE